MRTAVVVLVPGLLLAGCRGSSEPLSATQEAAAACASVAPLLGRESLRRSDVSALGRAVTRAERAAEGDARFAGLRTAMARASTAAEAVEASSRQATSNTEQSRIDAAFRTAKEAVRSACA